MIEISLSRYIGELINSYHSIHGHKPRRIIISESKQRELIAENEPVLEYKTNKKRYELFGTPIEIMDDREVYIA